MKYIQNQVNAYQACQTLSIDSDSSFEEIKYAYRKLALEFHPDKNVNENDGKKFKIVTEAYHYLKNNHKRQNAKKSQSASEWIYTNTKAKKEQTFRKRKPQWGAPPGGKPPEEDWSKFTQEFEDANPDFWEQYKKEFWEKYDTRINHGNKEDRKKTKSEPKLNLSVFVDPSLCIGCCSCETIAPEVFTVDKLSKMNPKSRAYNEKGASYNKIMNAAETCPTKAINVSDKDRNKKLYPW